MTNFKYFPNIPNPPDDPADDAPQMQTNTLSTKNLIDVDHVTFLAENGGYHKVIHMITQGGDPADIPNIGQIYTKQILFNGDTDEALYFESGGGRITQLTTVGTASAGPSGYSFLPGGIILQWGIVNGTHGSSNVFNPGDSSTFSYPIPFPNNIFTIQANLVYSTAGGGAGTPSSSSAEIVTFDKRLLGTSSAKYFIAGSGSSYVSFFWYAIGN